MAGVMELLEVLLVQEVGRVNMNIRTLEILSKIISNVPNDVPGLFKYKLGIIKKLSAPYLESLEEVKKEYVTEELVEFENIRSEYFSKSRTQIEIDNFSEEHKDGVLLFEKFIKLMDDIYKYEVDIKLPKFTIDELPDELESLSMEDFSTLIDILVDD